MKYLNRSWLIVNWNARNKRGWDSNTITFTNIIQRYTESFLFPSLLYFSVFVGLRWLYHHMLAISYISRKAGFCVFYSDLYDWELSYYRSLMMCANNRIHCDPIVIFACLHITLPHYHYYADRSEGTELLKCLSGTFCLGCVSKIKSILSIIFHKIYRAVCIQLTHFSFDDCKNTCTLSHYHHHQIGRMTHLPLFRVRSWSNGMGFLYSYSMKHASICHVRNTDDFVQGSGFYVKHFHTWMTADSSGSVNNWFRIMIGLVGIACLVGLSW